jgi:subtilisin family serine protease
MKVPNDTYYSKYQWHLPQINAPQAWDISTGLPSVIIAIVDTGVDLNHPDLKGKVVQGFNAITGTSNAMDDEGHGSHVSGLAAASSNNATGTTGVCWGAKIMPIKVLNSNGEGSDSDIAEGVTYAADHGAKVISMSLGSSGYSRALLDSINRAMTKGCLVVAAAGNEYQEGNPVDYPAGFTGVMAVGASGDDDQHAYYSQAQNYVSVVAPGGNAESPDEDPDDPRYTRHWIFSTFLTSQGGYQWEVGTSQATPIVAGLAALLWSVRPDYTAKQIRAVIEKTAKDIDPAGKDKFTGYGRVDAGAAMSAITGAPTDTTPPAVSITFPANGSYLTGAVGIQGSVDDPALQSYQVQYGLGQKPASWTNIGTASTQSVQFGPLVNWDTDALTEGVYSLRVVATDQAGNTADSSTAATLSVTVDHTSPVITINQPTEGLTLTGVKTITGTVTDSAFNSYSVNSGAKTSMNRPTGGSGPSWASVWTALRGVAKACASCQTRASSQPPICGYSA